MIPYTGVGLDRGTDRREDPGWVAALVADGRGRVWALWRDQCLVAGDPAEPVGMLAYARGLLYWNRQQRYCGRCGAAAEMRHAGHLRVCSDAECGALLFPRIAPAVLALVETISEPRRCLLARHAGSAVGGYSLLTGWLAEE
jgi:NADH pyrophosphatase NudC (nudix superfamily)